MCRASSTNSSPRTLSRPLSPQHAAGTCSVYVYFERSGPAARDVRPIDPGERNDLRLNEAKVRAEEAMTEFLADRFLDLQCTDPLERTVDGDGAYGLIEQTRTELVTQQDQHDGKSELADRGKRNRNLLPPARLLLLAPLGLFTRH